MSAASSPLRSDGNKSVAGSPRGVGNSSATARQSPSKTDPGIQMAGSRRDGGQTQASGPGNSQESTLEVRHLPAAGSIRGTQKARLVMTRDCFLRAKGAAW